MRPAITRFAGLGRPTSRTPYTFARNATGYLGGPTGMETFAANTRRELTVHSASRCNCVLPVDEDPRGAYGLSPRAMNQHGLFAISLYTNSAYLYCSANGVTDWTLKYDFGYATSKDILELIVTRTGRILAFVEDGAGKYAVWYSTGNNDGTAFTRAKDNLGADLSFAGYPAPWLWGQHHGTIIAGGWISPDVAGDREIWRSTDDGQTWTRTQLLTVDDTDHAHAICYHAGLNRWVVDYGDDWLGAEMRTFFSDNDGMTWYNPLGAGVNYSTTGRITRLIDIGHPTRLVVGSDHHLRVGWFDLDTLESGTYCRFQSTFNSAYAFMLAKHDGVWYWGSSDADASDGYTPVIRISTDLVHWVTYWRATRGDILHIYQFVGELNGKLHFRFYDTSAGSGDRDEHLILDKPKIVKRRGVLISPAKQNLLADRVSKCDRLTDWTLIQSTGGAYSTWEVDANNPFGSSLGSLHMVKVNRPYNEYTGVTAVAATPTVVGKRYQAHAWVKGTGFFVNVYCSADQGASDRIPYAMNPDGWTEIWGKPYTAADTSTTFALFCTQQQGSNSSELWIGAAEIVECPAIGEWTPGGVAQPADVVSAELDLPSHWTHLFSYMALNDTPELTDGSATPVPIRTWLAPGGDFVTLYFDPATGKLGLESTVDSVPSGSPIETTGTRRVEREHLFRFVVRHAAGQLWVSVYDGALVEHIGPLAHAGDDLFGDDIVLTTGNESGALPMPGVLLDDYVLDGCFSEDQAEAVFDKPSNGESAFTPDAAIQLV